MHQPAAALAPDLRVFISSTFDDLRAERDYLMKHVFPELRRICRSRGGDLTEIDLRWGVTEEQATTRQIVKACLEEISRHRPWFISIIGDRYGWIPTRDDIADAELLRHFPWLRAAVDQRRSLIDLEITEGALRRPLMADRAFFYVRAPIAHDPRNPRAVEEHERLTTLKERIRASGFSMREGFTTPEELAALIRADLLSAIDRIYPLPHADDALAAERAAHRAFALTRRRGYVEVADTLDHLDSFVAGGATPHGAAGIVITGASGVGKSALIAQWAERIRVRKPDAFIITHFVGAFSGGGDHVAVLRHIIAEIRERYGVEDAMPVLAEDIVRGLPAWLSRVQREDLVIAIDALNQLDEVSQRLGWLPEHVPPRIRFVFSATGSPALDALRERAWPEVEVHPLTVSQRRQVVERYLIEYGKRFDTGQLDRISLGSTSANPLYLRTQLEELRAHGSYEELNGRIEYYLAANSLDDLFQRVLLRLEEEHGADGVRDVMALIWASRGGLDERELADLTGLAPDALGRLLAAFGYHLMHRNGLLGFYHDHVRRAVEARYIDEFRASALHTRLGEYFSTAGIGARRATEEPWQWLQAGNHDRLRAAIADVPLALAIKRHTADFELARYWVALGAGLDVGAAYAGSMAQYEITAEPAMVAGALDVLAQFLVDLGQYRTAEVFARRSLELHEGMGPGHEPAIASSLDRLAALHYHTGRSAEAIELAERALALRCAALPDDHPDVARTLAELGALQYGAGQRGDAESVLRNALRAARHRDLPVTATILNNLGALRLAEDAFEDAAGYFEQARDINRRLLGPEHPEVAFNLVNLAFALQKMNQAVAAEAYYLEALTITERSLGREHPQVAAIATNLGTLYRNVGNNGHAVGDIEAAEALLRRALAIHIRNAGPESTESTASMVRLGNLLKQTGRNREARTLYQEALCIRRTSLPFDHPDVLVIAEKLASTPSDA